MRSLEPGEDWGWCFIDQVMLDFSPDVADDDGCPKTVTIGPMNRDRKGPAGTNGDEDVVGRTLS